MSKKAVKRKLASEINVVPYIDVMLVLLVIFMVTAPMLVQGVKVELPRVDSTPIEQSDDEPLIVSVKADGSYYLNLGEEPKKAVSLAELKSNVSKVLSAKPQTSVLVWGDQNVRYGVVVSLMGELQAAGVPDVGLVTDPLEP